MRLKIGIDRPHSKEPSIVADYVISKFDRGIYEIKFKVKFIPLNKVIKWLSNSWKKESFYEINYSGTSHKLFVFKNSIYF